MIPSFILDPDYEANAAAAVKAGLPKPTAVYRRVASEAKGASVAARATAAAAGEEGKGGEEAAAAAAVAPEANGHGRKGAELPGRKNGDETEEEEGQKRSGA